jgi:hypothetical protein
VSFWAAATNAEVYGCLIYNNGWEAPDRGHGHGIYTQNATGTKQVRDNILFGNLGGYAVHCYGSETATLQGYEFSGNTVFSNDFLIGGMGPAGRMTIAENYLYERGLRLGFSNQQNEDATVRGNYVYAAQPLSAMYWRRLTVTDNRFLGRVSGAGHVSLRMRQGGQMSDHTFNSNNYLNGRTGQDQTFTVYTASGTRNSYYFHQWQQFGYDLNSSFISNPSQATRPTGVDVFVRLNAYEPGRANVMVFNWNLQSVVDVDLGQVLEIGDRYEIRNAQDYFSGPVLSGVYDGTPVGIPMTGLERAAAIGTNDAVQTSGPEFGVFIVVPQP